MDYQSYQYAYNSELGQQQDPYADRNQYNYQQQESERDILEYLSSMGIFKKVSTLIEPPLQQTEDLKKKLHVLQLRIEQNFPFTDTTFSPSESSISDQKLNHKIEWKRLTQLVNQDSLRFLIQGKPIDFIQSSTIIEDKYVLSALNILLSKMDMIVRNFEITQINNAGIFGIWVNQAGQWDLMVLDDNFPTKNNQYCMAQTNNGIWLMVLEKALAKMYGNYMGLNGGFTHNALTDLTGAPTEIIDDGTEEEWFQYVDSWIKRGFLVFAENDINTRSSSVLENSGYSFSVLAIENLGQEIIVKLKSPINQLVYQGQWSNQSSKWTSALRDTYDVKPIPSEDGTFWMSLSEFRNMFQYLGNLRTHENYVYKWINIDHTGRNQSIIKFTVEQQSHMYVILHQQDERIATKTSPNYEYPCTRIMIAKVNNSQYSKTYEYVGANYQSEREIFLEDIFQPGDYILTIEVYWVQAGDRTFTVNFYGESVPTVIQELDTANLLDIQKQIIQHIALNNPMPTQKIRDYSNNGEPNIKIYNDIIAGMVYFVYQNRGTKKLRERVEMAELENLIIQKPFDNNNQYEVIISPGNEQVVVYKYNPFGEKFSFNCKIKAGLDPINQSEVKASDLQNSSSVYNGQNMFNSKGLRQSKSLKFNNNMRSSKVHQLVTRHDTLDENRNQYQAKDLIQFMKVNSVPSKRMWKEQEIGVYVYNYQHPEGVVILIQNLGEYKYEEKINFQLENLRIENSQDEIAIRRFEVDYNNNSVYVMIEPGSFQMIFLDSIKKGEPYVYKQYSLYKYHSR
ncbi:calpain family cysteine protease (macronuclear) [Tetrahymena thermophila SB210]|uniref:Calpain family cysteine protease n=1 Tax=Tetrahymena thermophila (strain SB210) TaxID=312017 RepID=W7X4E3_TETTS|nr:calpain family cysteine protease [Tetrahymena thermophila SB210]EWS74185.1 calpain family cysteine protease [Tetrahymena thermophila SB210]|eukprot:XP_012653277.1 calpain family cysteine protease [Tetrahymena thermophila SB210]